jgi:hypothetical protein
MAIYQASFQISSKQGRQAYIALLWRRYSVYIVSSLFVFVVSISILSDPFIRPLASFGLGFVCGYWYSWIYGYYRAGSILTRLTGSKANLNIGEEYITFETPDGTSSLRWSAFVSFHCNKSFYILTPWHRATSSFIPTEALTPDACAFLKLKLKEARVRIE